MTGLTSDDRLDRLERQQALAEQYFTAAFWTSLDCIYDITLRDRSFDCLVCGRSGLRDEWDILTDSCMFGGGRLER